jgi:hypothetical protein
VRRGAGRFRRPLADIAKERRQASSTAIKPHQARQNENRANLVALGIAPERAPWRRIRREAQEAIAEEERFARRQAAALESARLARELTAADEE